LFSSVDVTFHPLAPVAAGDSNNLNIWIFDCLGGALAGHGKPPARMQLLLI
jgi:hypothetical protein